jgi:hypothetical protein
LTISARTFRSSDRYGLIALESKNQSTQSTSTASSGPVLARPFIDTTGRHDRGYDLGSAVPLHLSRHISTGSGDWGQKICWRTLVLTNSKAHQKNHETTL